MSGVSNTQRVRALIKAARDTHGWSYDEIARRSRTLAKSTIHQIATTETRTDLLTREQLEALADGLGLPYKVVRDAALADAGLEEISGPDLPAEAYVLTEAMGHMPPASWLARGKVLTG